MMGVYNSYAEAVIANGSVKGIRCAMISNDGRNGVFGLEKDFSNVTANTILCRPSDYLQRLADFLEGGMSLVSGDKYTGRYGDVVDVQTHNLSTANTPLFGDETRFVVKAAAYNTETPEEKEAFDAIDTTPHQVESLSGSGKSNQVEWKNGDDVVFGEDNRKGIYIAYDTYNVGHVVYSRGDYFYVLGGDFRKPETPEEREERERLEAAYDLYCEVENADGDEPYDFDFWRTMERKVEGYLAIVDKTGYRKNADRNQ